MVTSNPTAAFLVIGNEILSGRTKDSNVQYAALALAPLGIYLNEVRVVADNTEDIIQAVNALRKRYSYLFTTGGIGPTHDDITSDAIAKAFGVKLVLHKEALARLEKHYAGTKQTLNEARRKMAYIPKGAVLIDNPISAAPGFNLENVYVMAGVPVIMQAMLASILPELKGGKPTYSCTIATNLTEGVIASDLTNIQKQNPTVDIGSYPHIRDGKLGVSLVARSIDKKKLKIVEKEIQRLISYHKGQVVFE